MEEMLDDALNVEEDEEVEEEAVEEVDKILFELTNGKLGQAGTVNTELPVCLLHPGKSPLNNESRVGCANRRGASGEGDGTLQGATQWFAQWLEYRFIRCRFFSSGPLFLPQYSYMMKALNILLLSIPHRNV
jgi:hypothetical protein